MLIDIHDIRPDGRVGRLIDTIDVPRTFARTIRIDGREWKLLTGAARNFVCIPEDEWEEMEGVLD